MKKKSVTFLVFLTLLVMIDRIANAQTYVDLGLPSPATWIPTIGAAVAAGSLYVPCGANNSVIYFFIIA